MTPRELGYRMPAEWDRHSATWLSWPRPTGISFPNRYEEVLPAIGELVRVLARHETVNINVSDTGVEAVTRRVVGPVTNVFYHRIPSAEPWCRDHGPTFVTRGNELAVVDWRYNAYGGKFKPHDADDAVPERIAGVLGVPVFQPGIVLEGGSIDVNGAGMVLTTEACLLNPNRNPHLTKPQIEQYLRDYLGVAQVLWLGDGIVGDDTDGHVDDLTRFVNESTVVTVVEQDRQDVNYAALQENLRRLRATGLKVVELPMPGRVEYQGQRLPASYANFYIANDVVVLPTYRNTKTDQEAQSILQALFPDRQVVPVDSSALIWGLGSFHCLTQQQPATPSNAPR